MTGSRFATLLRVNLLLAALGAVMGAVAAVPFTWLGHLVTRAPWSLTLATYLWNIESFAIMGAILGPALAWVALRRVPVGLAAFGTGLGAILGGTIALLISPFTMFVPFSALGAMLAAWGLQRKHRADQAHRSLPATERGHQIPDSAGGRQ